MVEEQAIRVEVSAARLASQGIMDILRLIVQSLQTQHYGEQSLRQLNHQGRQLSQVDLDNKAVHKVKRQLKEYAVDFAVTKGSGDKLQLWFKGQDAERVQAALENCIADMGKEKSLSIPTLQEVCDRAKVKLEELNAKRLTQEPEIGGR